MPMHFAVSELILAIACLGAMWILWNRSIRFAAMGLGILGLAAGLGTIRFAFGLGPEFALVHRMVSQHGGLISAGLIALSLVDGVVSPQRRLSFLLVTGGAVAVSVFVGLTNSSLQPLILLAWAMIIMLFSPLQPFRKIGTRMLACSFAAILPLNALFVRRSPALGVDLSWHLYHVLLAVWAVAIAAILVSINDESPA